MSSAPRTPAQGQATEFKSDYGLENIGLTNLKQTYWNLPVEALYEEIIYRNEGKITQHGPILTNTGKHTARSANDKFIVKEFSTQEHVWWGQYNRPFAADKFDDVFNRLLGYFQGRDAFVQDCSVCADPEVQMPIRIVTERAWHSLFARNMFMTPKTHDDYRHHVPQFTILCAPSFKGLPQIDGTQSDTFIILNFERQIGIIGNSLYAGEIKKSIFTVLNYLLPLRGIMPMHCSANIGAGGDVAIFFGLSGTGKTTLSADPTRGLIGDDEHGWSNTGVFNFEAGCYAKVIRLSPTAEPQIYACTRRFGTILENVVFDPGSRLIDLDDESITENTRMSYPLDFIENAVAEKRGGHPKNIVLLTCDASGVMPPIAKLTTDQAMYQFISGYTSKIAGTEVGLGREPEMTFSTCFGAPFMVHHPSVYAQLLKDKIDRYGAHCWLVNTGWIGGSYGVGKRISIQYTRALLNAALCGKLLNVEYYTDPVFGFQVPKSCEGVPSSILNPADSWSNKEEYMRRYRELASRFVNNFKKFAAETPNHVRNAGPKL
ncbi:MAG: phosphoenolpyruvate carboxykinase (ATP) [Chloroflexi bacterium]|nr:phosphoenolpyruvate carboxykinase (ATP) [Chloroflexota bacterium]